ncbi:hypothetical protein CIP107528_01329 [Corynebacterium diphtheriae]|nr:hypothetical protein CIP107528_01329 [Corynebacterium diphtheriae]
MISKLWIRHDCRRIRVDQSDTKSFFFKNSARLCSGIVKLTRLSDNDWTGTDNQDVFDVIALWHYFYLPGDYFLFA